MNTPSSRAEPVSPTTTLPEAAKLAPVARRGIGRPPGHGTGRHAGKLAAELRRFFAATGLHATLVLLSLILVLPFVWMVLASLKELSQIGVGTWLPQPPSQYQAADVVDPERVARLLSEGSPITDASLRPIVERTLADLPAAPWTSGLEDRVRESLAAALNRVINTATGAGHAILDPDVPGVELLQRSLDQEQVVQEWRLKHEQAVQALEVARRATPGLTVADGDQVAAHRRVLVAQETYQGELAQLNRRQLDDLLGTAVRPSQALQWQNYLEVFRQIPFGRYYINSIFIACWVTFLQVFTSSLAAFAFARLEWPGRDKVFLLYLATMMLPGLVMMIPNYQVMIFAGLVDTMTGLVLPAAFTAFGTFLLRQFMLTIPKSLDEAAEIDGASKWRVYWDIILPMARPGLITLAIFTFMGAYHNFFWPLVMLKSQHKYTLPIGLLYFDSSAGQETNLLMAAVTMSVFPMILVFVLLQKYLVKGIQLGAVKG